MGALSIRRREFWGAEVILVNGVGGRGGDGPSDGGEMNSIRSVRRLASHRPAMCSVYPVLTQKEYNIC
jgi:hypothetical protein